MSDSASVDDPNDREACWQRALALDAAGIDHIDEVLIAQGWSPPLAIMAAMRVRRRTIVLPEVPWRRDSRAEDR